jgi:hypothetical protein
MMRPSLRLTSKLPLAQSGLASGRADLLAITRDGRLTVLELKAGEDIHLPLQALDYWRRIAVHSKAGELDNLSRE